MIVQISELHSWFTIPNSQIRDYSDSRLLCDSRLMTTRPTDNSPLWGKGDLTIHETALLNLWFRLLSSNRGSWIVNWYHSWFTIHDSWTIRDGADKNESCVGKGASSKAPGYSRLWLCDSWLMHVMTSAEDVLKKNPFVIRDLQSWITNHELHTATIRVYDSKSTLY